MRSASDGLPPLAVTAGEPAGIGPELCLALRGTALADDVVVLTDPAVLEARAERLGVDADLLIVEATDRGGWPQPESGRLRVLPVTMPAADVCGRPDPANAQALLDALRIAVDGCRQGLFSGLVTAPLQKSAISDAGIPFSGHTEFLATLTDAAQPVMLLIGGPLRVALATTHLPLSAVPSQITQKRLSAVLRVLHAGLIDRFGIAAPRISVLGLNPHAGEGGHLGHEDAEIIRPVVEKLAAEGMKLLGPLPADTAFTPAGGSPDAVLAMYHDQGLPVLKYAGFGSAVNVTLGLPIVRTSVDHGTALDIAGSGRANAGSLIAAIELARELAVR
ncbi:MAG: 4-hydroxythreonine-4-phosphate dehydrogenase PdxA [Woeseiaceae bacterium]|nr:4-hydroxythreonine-4-phosphate dehydrogenase PdxA [Woeseiaceae bacterium]